jgi:glutamate/aspartate transport system substrate-binding protein
MPARCLLLALALAFSTTLPAGADELKGTLKQIHDSKTVRLGHLKTAVPFSFVDQGVPQGYSVELCKRVVGGIQQQLGLDTLSISWVEVDEANRFDMVMSGKIDLECGTTTNTLSRQEQVDFSLPTWVDGATFAVKADSPIKTHADLGGKKIAVMSGTTTEPALKRALANSYVNAEVIPVKSHVEGLELLFRNKADAYASDNTVLIGLSLAVQKSMQLRISEAMFSYEPYGLMLRKDDGDFRRAVNRVIAGLYRGGGIKEIYMRWFGKIGEPTPLLAAMFLLNSLPE